MRKLFCALLFSFLLITCYSQSTVDKDKERIDGVCDKFMQDFQDGKITQASQLLKENSVLDQSTIDKLQKGMVDQLKSPDFLSYGEILSYEFVAEHKIKNIIVKRFYILKFKYYYLKFYFTIYNNGSHWAITGFRFDDDLKELL